MNYRLTTLGCKVNQYDSAALSQLLADTGFQPAAKGVRADLAVVSTCCVTASAMRKSRQAIRRALKASPDFVLVVGCYSDFDRDRLEALLDQAGVEAARRLVTGHHDDLASQVRAKLRDWMSVQEGPSGSDRVERGHTTSPTGPAVPHPSTSPRSPLAGHLEQPAKRLAAGGGTIGNEETMSAGTSPVGRSSGASGPSTIKTRRSRAVKRKSPGTAHLPPLERFPNRQRAFVKIQDGCDAFCTYCIVPFTRAVVRSRPAETILAECRQLIQAGHREIVLCGVFLGAFGRDTAIRRKWAPQPDALADLLARVADLPGLWRVRLSSLEPADVSDALLDVLASQPAVAPHLHLPLQSGSDAVLRRMNRQYRSDEYRRAADRLRRRLDRPAITADVIVGFPGESENDFQATLDIARHAGLAKIHAFPFSPRRGTAAWTFRHDAPPGDVVKDRLARLADLERELARNYRKLFVGQTVEALVEGPDQTGPRTALTDRYLTVHFRHGGHEPLAGTVRRFYVDTDRTDGLAGQLADEN